MRPFLLLAALAAACGGLALAQAAGPASTAPQVHGAPVHGAPAHGDGHHAAAMPDAGTAGDEVVVTPNPDALGASYAAPELASLGGPFTLLDHDGHTVTQASWPGQWLLITFGFPGCRESCPVALDHVSKALDLLGPDADRVQPLFVDISLDKQPDLRAMKQFVGNFHERLIGLGGTRAQTFPMLRNYMVRREYAHMSMSLKETGPRINHTTYFYMVDPQGKVRGYFYHDLSPERMAEVIRRQTQGG